MIDLVDSSVIIPVRGEAALTRSCLDALLRDRPDHMEVIVVDDGSVDATRRLLVSYGDSIRVVEHGHSRGFSAACNAGAAVARGNELVFLNNDTIPRTGWLDALRDYARTEPAAGAVGARLLYPDDTIQHAGVVFDADGTPRHRYRGFPAQFPAVLKSRRFQAVTGACILIPRDIFEALRGFDIAFTNGYEDIDLCLRIGEAGREVHYCADAVVVHLESGTRGQTVDEKNVARYRRRWKELVYRDETAFFVADGLVRFHNHSRFFQVEVDPNLGVPFLDDRADGTVERQLLERAHRLHALQQEVRELRARPEQAMPVRLVYSSDGRLQPTTYPREAAAAGTIAIPLGAQLQALVRPLSLDISGEEPVRTNILMPELPPAATSGSTRATLEVAAALASRGRRVRLICGSASPRGEAGRLSAWDGLIGGLGALEVIGRPSGADPLPVNPDDVFVATTWWSAHVAHQAAGELGTRPFAYLISAYAPGRFPAGSYAAAALASYALPHRAVFTCPLLFEWFRSGRRGVFGSDPTQAGLVLAPPIIDLGEIAAENLHGRRPRRVLVHAGSEADRASDMFELAIGALELAIARGSFGEGWEFTLNGATRDVEPISLGKGHTLDVFPHTGRLDYERLLMTHDLGLALSYSPACGLSSIEMASAGMTVITNTFETKTRERLSVLSSNLLGVEPTIEAVAAGLIEAEGRTEDIHARAAGARVAWARSGKETFTQSALEQLERLL